jgi:hypothetical protein
MIVQLSLEIVVLFSKASQQLEVELLSPIAGTNQSIELWRGRNSGSYVAYHQDAYYNQKLQIRRQQKAMHHPHDQNDPLDLVGQLWGTSTWSAEDVWEFSRTKIELNNVCIDEI